MTPLEVDWNDNLILFARITIASMLVPIMVALFYRKEWNQPLFVTFLYCVFTFSINIFEQVLIASINANPEYFQPILTYWGIDNTFFLLILYHVKNFLLLGWLFSLIFPVKPFNRLLLWSGRILALTALINYCFIEGYQEQGTFNPIADALFVVILPLLYLWYSQGQSLRIPLKKNPFLWISLGLLIPNLLGLFLVFAGEYIHRTDFILYAKIKTIKNIFEIAGQICIAIGFTQARFTRFIITPGKSSSGYREVPENSNL